MFDMKRPYLFLLFFCFGVLRLSAQRLVGQQRIDVHTRNVSLVFTVGENKKLYQSYFGARLAAASVPMDTVVESYAQGGGPYLFEPAIRIVHADGNPSLDLRVSSFRTDSAGGVGLTTIVFSDPVYPVTVTLELRAFMASDVITSRVLISHQEKSAVRVSNFASSMLHFQAERYILTQFHGDWAKEMHMDESLLTSGIKIIDSKLGSRADMYQTPAFLLSLGGPSTEETGDVLAGTLAWSGSFQLLFEVDEKDRLSVLPGMNPYASDYVLDPGKELQTPEFIFTYSSSGRGRASRNLHDWARAYGVLAGKEPRMTLLNNWESTQFAFNEAKLDSCLDEARKLGVDLFLLDDGWFGNKYPRNSDHVGLGDWQENAAKLPHGLGRLEADASSRGVKFGLWVEPEMVSPRSELYEKHPDWVLKLPNRSEHYFRNQLVLDLVNPAVQDFVYGVVDDLLTKHPGIAYLKWDCNRMMTNTYSPYLGERQSNVYIDYVRGLYAVLARLRVRHPAVPMMLCSGGGGRTDYGALKYFTEFWPSDNTDAMDRIFIQWGYSYFFPANTVSCHVTSWGKEPLKFRTDVAMMGRLGYDLDVSKMSSAELGFSQRAIREYQRLSGVIQQGDLYRLVAPYGRDRAALMYVDSVRRHAVLFSYVMQPRYGSVWAPVRLAGLDPSKFYRVREINRYPGARAVLPEDGKVFSGSFLMNAGLNVSGEDAWTSMVVEIIEESPGRELVMPFGKGNRVVYDLGRGVYSIELNGKKAVEDAAAVCGGDSAFDSRDGGGRTFAKTAFGYVVKTGRMSQLFYLYPNADYCSLEVRVDGVKCNYISVMEGRLVSSGRDMRALKVPFDNDMYVRYDTRTLHGAAFTSSEVTAVYDTSSREGMVMGSLEQGVWKSGVRFEDADVSLFAGLSDSVITHDRVPHGVVGLTDGYCRSPRMVVGRWADWRDGMEEYARLCMKAEPRVVFSWNKPTPMVWNSWGAIQTKLSLEKVKGVVDFLHDSCVRFRRTDGSLFIDLDAFWDNMTPGGIDGDVSKLREFIGYCRQKGMRPGVYWTPFADWGKSERPIAGTPYRYEEAWTRQNGKPVDIDGGRAMDPTHPGTRWMIVHVLSKLRDLGFEMIKVDFLGHGAIEADHFYDTRVTTGMEAFRQGMRLVDSVLDGRMLLYAAISPNLATSRYVHMRRIACDAFIAIDNSEYTLNSTGYGWWLGRMYNFIDADHVVFDGAPEGMNRARLAASLVTGTLTTGDDYSVPGKWRGMGKLLLQKEDLLAIARKGVAFRPVSGERSVNVFTQVLDGVRYVAVFNYGDRDSSFSVGFEGRGKELFSGADVELDGKVMVPASDVKIFRLK